jgi:hypothetical protein
MFPGRTNNALQIPNVFVSRMEDHSASRVRLELDSVAGPQMEPISNFLGDGNLAFAGERAGCHGRLLTPNCFLTLR